MTAGDEVSYNGEYLDKCDDKRLLLLKQYIEYKQGSRPTLIAKVISEGALTRLALLLNICTVQNLLSSA